MLHTEFASAYDREKSYLRSTDGLTPTEMHWGHLFGRVVHDHLNGIDNNELTNKTAQEYDDWHTDVFLPWFGQTVGPKLTTGLGHNAHGFHAINGYMLEQWARPSDNPQERCRNIRIQQNEIALLGFGLYYRHETLFKQFAQTGEKHPAHQEIEGLLNEFDSALVLLGIQQRNLAIRHLVPAPFQFETHKPATNIDFMVITDDEVTGVQVKGRVTPEDTQRYDRSRVMLLDANMDLGNVLVKKIAGRSSQQPVNWPGIICAQHVQGIEFGRDNYYDKLHSVYRKSIMRNKFLAKQLTRGIRPNYQQALDRVEGRLLPRLGLLDEAPVPAQTTPRAMAVPRPTRPSAR